VFTVLTEIDPTSYWLVCGVCGRRWALEPESLLLPQTRLIFEEHQGCGREGAGGATVAG